jgi:hypothetical protein
LDWESLKFGVSRSAEMRWSKINPSQCKLCSHRHKITCIRAILPDKETCERLCEMFFATVFPLIPVLHLPSFADDFRTFWDETGSKREHDSEIGPLLRSKPSFVCLLSSIKAIRIFHFWVPQQGDGIARLLRSQFVVLQRDNILNGILGLPGAPELRCWRLGVQMIG